MGCVESKPGSVAPSQPTFAPAPPAVPGVSPWPRRPVSSGYAEPVASAPVMPIKEMLTVPPVDAAFFRAAKYHEDRDFVVVVDKSGSMNAGDVDSRTGQRTRRWNNVRNAVEKLVTKATEFDEDGIELYLFSSDFEKYPNVDSARKVIDIFDATKPRGSTDLAKVLNAAFRDHFEKYEQKPTTILVVTDGEPDSERQVVDAIVAASNKCRTADELSVTFVQVGDDDHATRFLRKLDDELPCRFDIVDTLKDDCLQGGVSFEELIYLSVTD